MAEFRVVIEGRIVEERSTTWQPDETELAGQWAVKLAAATLSSVGMQLEDARVTEIQRVDKDAGGEG